jgi:hypothetical protein
VKRLALHLTLFVFLLFLLMACTSGGSGTPPGVDGVFAPFYEQMGGERIFGEPITEAFPLEIEGLTVQYFQNLRLEYPTGQPQSVRISALGQWGLEGLREIEEDVVTADGRSRPFSPTNETVRDEFLAFYEAFEGEQVLGWPISPQLMVGGVRTQYFENGRLEWRPQLPVTERVQLGWVGQEHFDSAMAFVYREFDSAGSVAAAGITEAEVTASVQAPVVYTGDEQRLFVTVQTPQGDLVSEVTVTAVLQHDNTETTIPLGVTDGDGRLSQTLDLQNVSPGQDVEVMIVVENNGRVLGQTRLIFRTWW